MAHEKLDNLVKIGQLKVEDATPEENALLLTADRDFGELVFRQHRLSGGVILFRLLGIASET